MKDTLPKFGDSVILKVGANVGFREGLNANMIHINKTVNEQAPKLEVLHYNIVGNSEELSKQKKSINKKKACKRYSRKIKIG